MADLSHLKPGDTVFVVARRDRHRQNSVDRVEGLRTVAKVGRDYFYLDDGWNGKFRRDNGHGVGDFCTRQAFTDEAGYTDAKVREEDEEKARRAMFRMGRCYFERLSDAELAQLNALLTKLEGK